MMRKELCEGTGYSVAELNGVRHIFANATPGKGTTLCEQAEDALRTIEAAMAEQGSTNAVVHQAVFVRDVQQVDTCRRIMKEFYGPHLPATSYIPQPPCCGKDLAIEAIGIADHAGEVEIKRYCENLIETRHSGVSWILAANLLPDQTEGGVYDRSLGCFEKMNQMIAKSNTRYEQVIRTWLYLGDIVGPEGETQRYKELNRARTDFYEPMTFGMGRTPKLPFPVYPASTGIGTDGKGIVMGCIALASDRPDLVLVPLENPQQISAFDYGQVYSPRSPKFARAMAVAYGDTATIFVSGTASITASETRHIGDPEAQTAQTLENIEALIARDNFCRHGINTGIGATLDDLALLRVYVKYREDFEKIRNVCSNRLRDVPTVFVVGDVCRPDLLVEIEGIAIGHKG
jgi:enamine deaminase RidA (YjgF/YER057c/UK114 family)